MLKFIVGYTSNGKTPIMSEHPFDETCECLDCECERIEGECESQEASRTVDWDWGRE